MDFMLEKIPKEKHIRLSNYFNQIQGPLASLTTIQHFGFPQTPTANATCLQELIGHFRPRLSPDAQNSAFAKNGGCIQILDTILYRSPSQDHDEPHNFCSELKLLVTNSKQ